ncbi:hypothetical protein A3Q34_04825 [Colwellia sp. PAMC 20917]|jgi:hypothetical protein|uniref:hypothetical protein n=1 Tax=Colwellia sp. PAMC 20917 TaxID=1816218 RepID=UPI0008788AC9|nr:hypothetical protein [Colwellia sp. PAMC 20917]AOW76239.1 hypothetical protein A3Q34_04825 [Colwellia sp. PAMC 20917]
MSTLKSQVDALQVQIKLSSNSQENETIIKANTNILNRLNKSLRELTSNKTKFTVMPVVSDLDEQLIPRIDNEVNEGFLINESSELVLGDDVKALLVNAKKDTSLFIEKWKELEHKAQQDDSLHNSIVSLKDLTEKIGGLNDKYWDKWLANLENGFVVEEVVLKQQINLGKKEVYDNYNKYKNIFETEKSSMNINVDLVWSLNTLKEKLVSLRGQMDKSKLPEGVAEFLKQLDAPWSTPTLKLLTPTVLEWLTKQGLLDLKISR